MALVKVKPTSPGRRAVVKVVNSSLYKGRPIDALIEKKSKTEGRNNSGRITVSMLNTYITERVKELTEGFQTPIYRSQDDMGDFPLMILGKIE